ncbi:polysaccharide biosynthesis protein [Methanobrevibacter sp. YE315]|uniref:lipopolysaccharide biosynthesis protein n=1 Tax=Methanobrevibacter sp. YE315 TaxID=1609968 RepID=UPI000764EF80|nr:polysaccharide biosynthesis C-terminal domain-containing protein [Methanobrevibacter sp. YE315]AMD18128.1 polysaccharide biosynthesis protein [Methanobrevibacter sp. YE315]
MDEYVQFIKRIGIVGIANILISLSGLIFIPIITKNFSTADYGVWAQVNTLVALVPNIVNLGLPYTMVRFLAAEKDKEIIKQSFYSMMLLVLCSTMIMILIFSIFSNQIANALFDGNMQIMAIVTAISFFACINLMLLSYFRTFQKISFYSAFLVLQTYIGVGLCIVLTLMNYPLEVVVLGLLSGYLLVFIAMAILIIRELGFTTKFKSLSDELKFAIPTIPNNVSSWVVDSSDKFVIGIVIGSAAVGCYSPGYALGSILLMFLTPFAVLLPAVLPEYFEKGDMGKVNTFLTYSMKYFLLITIPAAVGMSLLSKPLLYVLTTEIIANQGYMITPLVALGAIFMGIYGIVNNIIILEKKTTILGYIWISVAILNIILNIIAVPYIGIYGAGISTFVCYFFAFAVTLIYSKKYADLPFDLKSLVKILIASTIMGIFVKLANPNGIINILIVIVIAVIIYFAALLLLKGIDKKEINLVKSMI